MRTLIIFHMGSRNKKKKNPSGFSDEACKFLKPNCDHRANLEICPRVPLAFDESPCMRVLLGDRKLPTVAGEQAGGRADREDRVVRGIHAPLTCYCELPAAPADNCHLSLGKRSQRQAEGRPFCVCCGSSP